MPGKPFTKPWIDKETRQPWGLFLNKSVVGFSASLNSYDAEDSGEELRLLDEVANNYQQVVIAASEAGSIGLYVPFSTVVGRLSTGNIISLTPANLVTLISQPQSAKAMVGIDLSGGAVTGIPILHTSRAMTLLAIMLLYIEASSADAGVTVTVGKESDADYYYTGASESSKAQWYENSVAMLATDLDAGDTIICGCAGGKVGDGEVLVCIEYRVN